MFSTNCERGRNACTLATKRSTTNNNGSAVSCYYLSVFSGMVKNRESRLLGEGWFDFAFGSLNLEWFSFSLVSFTLTSLVKKSVGNEMILNNNCVCEFK